MEKLVSELKKFGYKVSDLTDLGKFNPCYVFVKECEDCNLFINVNLQRKEITFYKVLKLTATNYEDLRKQLNSGDFHKALAYPVDVQLMKLIVDNFEVMTKFWSEMEEKRNAEIQNRGH